MTADEYNPQNQSTTRPEEPEEHETHTAALVLLVLATIVIVAVILSYSGAFTGPTADRPEPEPDPTSGYNVPVADADMQEKTGMDGMPSGFEIPESATISENYLTNLGESGVQRVVKFSDQSSVTDLVNRYQQWSNDNKFKIIDFSSNPDRGELVLTQPGQELTIVITGNDNAESKVLVTYVLRSDNAS